jgi:hypothetical protein
MPQSPGCNHPDGPHRAAFRRRWAELIRPQPHVIDRIPDHLTTAEAVRRAIAGAEKWLEELECRRVFSDFEDLSGRRLSDILAERGLTGRDQLGRVYFYDGSHLPVCKRGGVAAVTAPGSHVIFVCPAGFREHCSDPLEARAAIVHELLHTLGLGENPPSSRQITVRVMERCCR